MKILAAVLAIAAACLLGRKLLFQLAALIFGSALLAFLLVPLCRLLEKKLKRPMAAFISLAGILATMLASAALLLPALLRQLCLLIELLPDSLARLHSLAENLIRHFRQQIPALSLPEISFSGASGGIFEAARGAISTLSSAAGLLYRLFLIVVLSYFLLADRERILLRMELMIPYRWRKSAVQAGNMLIRELRLYLRGQFTIALAVGTIASAAMLLLGLQGAPLLGLLVGLFNIIPYFGPFLGGIPAVVTALSLSWQRAAMTVLALFLVQQIDGMLISPRVMGSITGFSPAVVMLALFSGARIGGISGMLLAMPTLMTVRTLYRVFVQQSENN